MNKSSRTDLSQNKAELALRFILHCGRFLVLVAGAEEERNAPESRKGNERIDDTCPKAVVAAEEPGNRVELEEPDAAPVERADDGQNESNTVDDHR